MLEDNGLKNATYVYNYDDAGNITSKVTYALTAAGSTPSDRISTSSYGYSSSDWGDLLTSYDGGAITYDAIGNPLSYYNGSSYTFTWTGRRLTGAVKGSNTFAFTYNDEGVRTSKTKNGVTTTYYLNGSQIIAEETANNFTLYIYDSEGSPIGMQYHGASYAEDVWDAYWFEKNLQGDIVAVYNSSGAKLVSYTYDAWGNATIAHYKFYAYDPISASSSYVRINGSLYVSEGHHTMIANVMKYGKLNSGMNMGLVVDSADVVTNMLWTTLKIMP